MELSKKGISKSEKGIGGGKLDKEIYSTTATPTLGMTSIVNSKKSNRQGAALQKRKAR